MSRITAAPPRPLLESDDRDRFDSGRASMNAWFRRHAWFNQANNLSRVTVITDSANGRIVGYVSLSASQIERAYLPKPQQRSRPDPVPALLLGQLAVDKDYQGQGHAADLMQYALKAALHISKVIGCMEVVTHPLDDKAREFYRQFDFEDLPFDPRRAMIVRMVDLERQFGEEE